MITVYVNSISKDHFLYAQSYAKQIDATSNPLSEPVKVHTNIENELGIFSIYNTTKDSLIIEW